MNGIGGFFELELGTGNGAYHTDALKLNTARNCLEYIIRARNYRKVYLPLYSCDVMLEPFNKLKVEYEFYSINEQLEPIFDKELKSDEALLYVNYFGLKQATAKSLAEKFGKQLIVDNAQAFFAKPIKGIDTFYSARKFFGVTDGAYLYTDTKLDTKFEQDKSYERISHLVKRIDLSAESAYEGFKLNEENLGDQPIKIMSKLTNAILGSIDYEKIKTKRRENYKFFEDQLYSQNLLNLELADQIPLVYPFRVSDPSLRKILIDNKIFVATYWPNVFDWCDETKLEYELAQNTLALPIDQRYTTHDLQHVVNLIRERL